MRPVWHVYQPLYLASSMSLGLSMCFGCLCFLTTELAVHSAAKAGPEADEHVFEGNTDANTADALKGILRILVADGGLVAPRLYTRRNVVLYLTGGAGCPTS